MGGGASACDMSKLHILSRSAAAVFGGYALVSAGTVFLAAVLPMARADAVLAATLSSFLLYTTAIIWVFAEQRLARIWGGLLGASIVLGGAGLLLGR